MPSWLPFPSADSYEEVSVDVTDSHEDEDITEDISLYDGLMDGKLNIEDVSSKPCFESKFECMEAEQGRSVVTNRCSVAHVHGPV